VVAVKANALGDYLRARRDQVHPEDVGLVPSGPRRVPGLRRGELAMLAGISAEYYLRLERGRDKNPSAQILDALARILRLDEQATQHLHELVNPARSQLACSDTEAVADTLDGLIEQFPMPAIVANRYQDVMAANPIACALSPGFLPGRNYLCWRLLDPAAREFFVDWDEATDIAVSGLRESAASCPDDPRMRALIDQLSTASARFRELWGRAEVGCRVGIHHLRHPQVGDLYLYRNKLNVPYSSGQHVIILRADPGSDSARALEELRSLSAALA
jgi:transcriptional regulator with XRE-family HTH domain